MSDAHVVSDVEAYNTSEPRRTNPREKLEKLGAKALSSTDLLSLVIGSSATAQALVRRHGLEGLTRFSTESWSKERGIGTAERIAQF